MRFHFNSAGGNVFIEERKCIVSTCATECRFQEWGPSISEELDVDKPTVCLCHAGVRSMQVANMLLGQGFTQVYNVSGGIEAYSCFVDPDIPRY